MSLAETARALFDLRERLPQLLGEREWSAIEATASALFESLEAAETLEESEAAIDSLLVTLSSYPVLSEPLRHALRAGTEPRGQRRGSTTRRSANEHVDELESSDIELEASDGGAGVFERWPHIRLDTPEPVPLAAAFLATVYVDTTPSTGEDVSTPLVLPDQPEVRLHVVLVTSHHFVVNGDDGAWITINRDKSVSTEADFTLRVVEGVEGIGVITAFLAYDGRPVGSVYRQVSIGTAKSEAPAEEMPDPLMRTDLRARRPDLTVEIAPIPESGGKRFFCTVSTPHLPEYSDGTTSYWDLPDGDTTKGLVLARMSSFTRAGNGKNARRAGLVGAGLDLFEAAPANFQQIYWALRDNGLPIDSIFVVSSEPYIPWELMIPRRDGDEDEVPIGVSSAVGRWVHPQHVSPVQLLELNSSYVIAPTYLGVKRLGFSAGEAQYVCDAFSGSQISPALFDVIEAVFSTKDAPSLLHLICHGADGADGQQVIDLDPDESLTDGMLPGMPGLKKAMSAGQPMVFLNACQIGRPSPALVGTGGFAARFIRLGARAVVAPIWSVRDDVASQVTRVFYDEVKAHPGKPFATILQDIRRRAYEGSEPEDSWAAYCFYGDPLAATPG